MRRAIAVLMTVIMLLCLSVCSFAENSQETQYTLHMDRNGKTLLDADGKTVKSSVKDAAVAAFYSALQGLPINWTGFNYMEIEVTADADGNVSLGKQTVSLQDGSFRTSSDAGVVAYVSADRYIGCEKGEATLAALGFDGSELGSYAASTEFDEYGRMLVNCLCPNCDENQDDALHMMVCGHYACEEGEVGHGAGLCGTPGHFNCDGDCHDLCTNCQKPLCSGLHGVGVCEHVHDWLTAGDCFGNIAWAYCKTCGEYETYEVTLKVPVAEEAKAEN